MVFHKILTSLFELIVPRLCHNCGSFISEKEEFLCIDCRFDLPYTFDYLQKENSLFNYLNGLYPIIWAGALCYYRGKDNFSQIMRNIKYKNQRKVAKYLGRIFANELQMKNVLDENIDVIIPVPLHRFRLWKRGYNQSFYIAKGMAEVLNCELAEKSVKRIRNNKSQTTLNSKKERINNTEGIFMVTDGDKLDNKHILIVDDIVTTGATIQSLIKTITDSCENSRISVATIARTEKY